MWRAPAVAAQETDRNWGTSVVCCALPEDCLGLARRAPPRATEPEQRCLSSGHAAPAAPPTSRSCWTATDGCAECPALVAVCGRCCGRPGVGARLSTRRCVARHCSTRRAGMCARTLRHAKRERVSSASARTPDMGMRGRAMRMVPCPTPAPLAQGLALGSCRCRTAGRGSGQSAPLLRRTSPSAAPRAAAGASPLQATQLPHRRDCRGAADRDSE